MTCCPTLLTLAGLRIQICRHQNLNLVQGFEEVIPFEYHDGYLTIHFEANKYQDIELTPLQEEALWCALSL